MDVITGMWPDAEASLSTRSMVLLYVWKAVKTETPLSTCISQKTFFMQFNLRLTSPLLPIPGIFLPSTVSPTHSSMLVCSCLPTSSAISSPTLMITPTLFPPLWDHPWNIFVLYPPGLLGLWSNRCGTTDTHTLFSTFKTCLSPLLPLTSTILLGPMLPPVLYLPHMSVAWKRCLYRQGHWDYSHTLFLMVGRPRGLHQSRGNPLFLQ